MSNIMRPKRYLSFFYRSFDVEVNVIPHVSPKIHHSFFDQLDSYDIRDDFEYEIISAYDSETDKELSPGQIKELENDHEFFMAVKERLFAYWIE